MEKKPFNVEDWKSDPVQEQKKTTPETEIQTQPGTPEIESIIQQIEALQIDIASAYSDWRDIGFAFSDAFGESGRDYFHRISRFYPDYSPKDCDDQFNKCLKSRGQGITLKTFFYRAKEAGIKIGPPKSEKDQTGNPVPTFPDSIFPQLPDFLKRVVQVATSNEERDILLLGSIVVISACLQKLYGIYDGKRVYPNLYLYITAQASAGKGRLVHCKQLVKPIHKQLREQAKLTKQQYEAELATYNERKGKKDPIDKPEKPMEKMLFLPANSSSTGIFQLMFENEGRGLLFETEGDTLSQAFKSEHGNYSDGFRKAFHHETISFYRRTDREYVDIESPALSTVLSGTPKQIIGLIPTAENGLFSRFIFYFMNVQPVWKNVFAISSDNGLDDYFDTLGGEFFQLYQTLDNHPEINFSFTADQQEKFNSFFEHVQKTYLGSQGLDYMATIRRLGLVCFRISMIFTALRIMESGDLPHRLICEERDFQASIEMVSILVQHSSKVFSELPQETLLPKRKNQKEKFLDALPSNFNRQSYLQVAASLNIESKTAEGYITDFYKKGLIHRDKKDHYLKTKPDGQETQDFEEMKD